MDTQDDCFSDDYMTDTSWLDTSMPEMPPLSEEEKALVAEVTVLAKAYQAEKAKQRAMRRIPEISAAGPSKKISIRLPRFLLQSIRDQAAELGVPYQTLIRIMLHEAIAA